MLVVITVTKFTHGAWAVIVLIPLLVLMFRAVNGHYKLVAAQLRLDGATPVRPRMRHRIIVPVSGIHRGVLPALDYARSLSTNGGHEITAVYFEINPENTEEVRKATSSSRAYRITCDVRRMKDYNEGVWTRTFERGGESAEQTEYLRVFVGQLRKKVEPDTAAPRYILTEPWIGYRFDPGS